MKGILPYTELKSRCIENRGASKMENKTWNEIISHAYKVLSVKKNQL